MLIGVAGCASQSDQADEQPPLSGTSDGWTTARGTIAGTGRADTALAGLSDVEWLLEYDEPLASDPPRSASRRSTPGVVVTENLVAATSVDPEHPPVAIDRSSQDVRWSLNEFIDPHAQEWERTPAPVAAGGELFVHSSHKQCRIAASDVVWKQAQGLWSNDKLTGDKSELYRTSSFTRIDPQDGTVRGNERERSSGPSPGVAVGSNRAIQTFRVDGDRSGAIVGYDDDWNIDWELALDGVPIESPPAISDGVGYLLTTRGTIAVNLTDGTVVWRTDDYREQVGIGLDEEQTVYVLHETETLVALNTDDGSRRWTAVTDRSLGELIGFDPVSRGIDHRCYAPIVTADAVVLSGPGGIAVFDRADGSIRWQEDWTLVGSPAVAFGDLYAITTDGIVAVRGK